MSHYTEIQTEFRDLECLLQALADIGITNVQTHEEPQQLRGYHNDLRQDKAHVIVPQSEVNAKLSGGASNDLGFVKKDGSYQAIVSDYDRNRWWDKKQGQLKQSYNLRKIKKEARRSGKTLSESKLEDGTIKLTLAV